MPSTSLVWFLALLRLSSALLDPILVPVPVPILVPIPISTLGLVSVPAPVPVTILCSSRGIYPGPIPRPGFYPCPRSHLRYCSRFRPRSHAVLVYWAPPPPSPSPFPPRPRSRSRSHPVFVYESPPPFPPHSRSRPVPVPMIVCVPVSTPDPVRSFPFLGPVYPLGTMHVYRHRALRTELLGARKHYPLSAGLMTRTEWKCLL